MPNAYHVLPTRMMDGSGKSVEIFGPLVDRLTGAARARLNSAKAAREADAIRDIMIEGLV